MDRRAAMAAMPYMGGGELLPLPPSIYLQVDECKSIPAVAAAFVGGQQCIFRFRVFRLLLYRRGGRSKGGYIHIITSGGGRGR
ncbi:unnamed protein product [Cuscuta epithymum]|uniref:Uncharacterized protein n=1 Tax=Cuscuta epithymum TaxID=186058 RepID=A0AAV0EEY0_9ASTE|nr:unnamed protein product [Cuscuta epithymum]